MTATKKHIPGKRIRMWHRADWGHRADRAERPSLRVYARGLAANGEPDVAITAKRWLAGKGLTK